jgi:alpha-L-glutamate ligase-like protein
MIGRYLALKRAGVLGLNARNGDYIMRYNQRRFYPLVDDKIRCKKILQDYSIAVPDLLDEVRTQHDAGHLTRRLSALNEFVIKPASGSGGDGIIVISSYRNTRWLSPGGRSYSLDDLQFHVSGILNGMYSLAGQPDAAMFESLVRTDPVLKELAPEGVPDIRVIIYRGVPVMAMMRLPTRQSGGRANLHQGAIGVGIDMVRGTTLSAVMERRIINTHPDSGYPVENFQIPDWSGLLDLAARCQQAVGLGYLGVDIVLDERRGPLVLELNARPGLAIQIANQAGLERRLKAVDHIPEPERLSPEARVEWLHRLAGKEWQS